MTIKALIHLWREFWFAPATASVISAYRILFGLLVLQICVVHLSGNFHDWYGGRAVVTPQAVMSHFWHSEPQFDLFLLFPDRKEYLDGFHICFTVAAAALTLGLFSRYSALIVWLCLLSMHHHDPFNNNGGDAFLRAVAPWLALSHCGDRYSLDALISRWRGNAEALPKPVWAQRMIQMQLALVYWQTFCCKIVGPQWLDGTAIYYATRLEDMTRFPAPLITDNLLLLKGLNYFTLVIELAGWTLIWFKETRYWVLFGLLFLHLGIDYMINLPVFEWVFICTLLTFVSEEDWTVVCLKGQQLLKDFLAALNSRKPHRADQP
jgi:hypothetical protein